MPSLLSARSESDNGDGDKGGQSITGLYLDTRLEATISTLNQLSPSSQDLVILLVNQLAQKEGITIALSPTMGLQTPMDGFDLWVAKLKQEGYSPRTISDYTKNVTYYLASDPVPTTLSIRSYLARRLNEVSAARVGNERKALKSFFAFLHEEGLWMTNLMNRIKSIKVRKRERALPTDDQIRKLLTYRCYRRKQAQRFALLVILLINTGLRITEAVSILKQSVNLARLEIRVIGKGNKERVVPISPMVGELMRDYMTTLTDESPYLFHANNANGYWDISSIEKVFRRVAGVTPHQLRHYFATFALKAGAKLEIISRILGHSSVGITADVYRHVGRDEMHQQHDRFAPLPETKLLEAGK